MNIQRNKEIRGTFLVDNKGRLQTRMPRGENIKFIINYIFANPCIGANPCRKALLQWRGIKDTDASRGQYASYFYDFYANNWYHKKRWNFIKDSKGNKRMILTDYALRLVDEEFQKRLKDWDNIPRSQIDMSHAAPEEIEKLKGYEYLEIVSSFI